MDGWLQIRAESEFKWGCVASVTNNTELRLHRGQTRSVAITGDQLCKLRPGYLTRPVHTSHPIAFNRDASSKCVSRFQPN